jgi:hypothetical protein
MKPLMESFNNINRMKQITILLIALAFPLFAHSQNDSEEKLSIGERSKMKEYLAGAVPEENGIVTFTKEFTAPGLDRARTIEIAKEWLTDLIKSNDNKNVNVTITVDKAENSIFSLRQFYMVFKKTALSLDRAYTFYPIKIYCYENSCKMVIQGIKYQYANVTTNQLEILSAEEMLSDKIVLNKSKTKIYPGYAKFRVCTIDNINELALSFQKKIDESLVKINKNVLSATTANQSNTAHDTNTSMAVQSTQPTKPVQPAQPAQVEQQAKTTVAANSNPLHKYAKISPYDFNENIFSLSSRNITILTAGDNGTNSSIKANLVSLGNFNGKPVVTSTLEAKNMTTAILENTDTFTLSFLNKELQNTPVKNLNKVATESGAIICSEGWLIIICKKVSTQTVGDTITCTGEIVEVLKAAN